MRYQGPQPGGDRSSAGFFATVAGCLPPHPTRAPLSTLQVLACGALIVTLSMGIRHGFGLWLQPITQAQGWTRENFAFALAIQNLSWGLFGIFAGMAADRFGAFRVLIGGALLYGLGLTGMALTTTPMTFALDHRRADRRRAGRHHLRRDLRRDRAADFAPKNAPGPWAWPQRRARSASS